MPSLLQSLLLSAALDQERRESLRRPGRLLDVLLLLPGDAAEIRPAQLENYSLTGVGLWLCEPLLEGTVLKVGIPDGICTETWQVTYWLTIRVLYCRPDLLGWIVGCEYRHEPSDGLLDLLDCLTRLNELPR